MVMIGLCVLELPPSHRSSSKNVIIELYSSYQEISRAFNNTNCVSIAAFSQFISNQHSLTKLSNSILLQGNINVYGRTLNESGNSYLCLIYYKAPQFIHTLKKSSNLHLLDDSISTFMNTLTYHKSNISMNVLNNIQSAIDLLSSINAQHSRASRDLVYWDNKCKKYTQQVTNCTTNKQPIASNAFKSQIMHDDEVTRNRNQRRYGHFFTNRQRYSQKYNNNRDNSTLYAPQHPTFDRSQSYYGPSSSARRHSLTRSDYKWSRKSTTNIHDIAKANEAAEKEAQRTQKEEAKKPELPSKYDASFTQITTDFADLSQIVAELKLDNKDSDDEHSGINTELAQSGIQQSVTAKIDEEDPQLVFESNATVIIHEDDLREREEDTHALNETDADRRSRSHHRRSKPSQKTRHTLATNVLHPINMSDTLLQFQSKYKKANAIKKQLISRLKTLLDEVENDVLPSFDDDSSESIASDDVEAGKNDINEDRLQKLKMLCASFMKLPANRMAQNGVAEGLILMKNIFETFTANDILNGEHLLLYNQVYSKIVKHIPQQQTLTLLSPSASATTTSSLSEAAHSFIGHNVSQTPFNTPNMSRNTSNGSSASTPSMSRITEVSIYEDDFARNIPVRKRSRGHNRSRSSIEEVMNECDDDLKEHYHQMMGTIGDDAEFKQKLKLLLVEVANNYANEDESQVMDILEAKKQVTQTGAKRQSLKIKPIRNDFVSDIVRIESDEEIQEKYWKHLSWNFDPISFGEHALVDGNTVVLIGWHLVKMNGWHEEFGISPHKLISFLYQIQEAYHNDNWYHNKYHAADVMNNMYWFLTECASIQKYLDAFDRFICVIAAAFHDVDHNGYNNYYHQRTKSYLAIRYNDQSILENHHIAYGFRLIGLDAKYNWISDLNDDKLIEKARRYLIRLILGTDMSLHKKHLQRIQTLSDTLGAIKDDTSNALKEEDKIDLLSAILHAADIANAAKERSICVEWAKRCIEEFRVQGDEEKRLFGKESQTLFSRKNPLESSQIGWINYVMIPYYKPLNELLNDDLKMLMNNLENNLKKWKEYKEYQGDDEKTNK